MKAESRKQKAEAKAERSEVRGRRSEIRTAIWLSLLLLANEGAHAQTSYSVDWWKIAGGGGASTGGVYSASGTIGQPDAGQASGGNFTVVSGFWGIVAVVQTTNAPFLSIARTATNTIVVWWLSPSTGWSPQQNSSLDTTNWTTPPETVSDNGTNKFILIAPPTGNRFYRLTR
jgi:hypothetical protein